LQKPQKSAKNEAGLTYRRAQRKMLHQIQSAHQAAIASGDIVGRPLAIRNVAMFQEHLGTMLTMVSALPNSSEIYDRGALVRDATLFCCRGIGLTEDAIRKYLAG
jgi:hypothetical protein